MVREKRARRGNATFHTPVDVGPHLQPVAVGKGKAARGAARRSRDDQAYRRALGVAGSEPLPAQLGSGGSAGASRGGPGAGQRRKVRNYPQPGQHLIRRKPNQPKLTGVAARVVRCPRCLAGVDQPCRDQYGKAYGPGHAARRAKAAAVRADLVHEKKRRKPKEPNLTAEQQAQRKIYRQAQKERESTSGPSSQGGKLDRTSAVLQRNAYAQEAAGRVVARTQPLTVGITVLRLRPGGAELIGYPLSRFAHAECGRCRGGLTARKVARFEVPQGQRWLLVCRACVRPDEVLAANSTAAASGQRMTASQLDAST